MNDNTANPFGSPAIAEQRSKAVVAVEQERAIAETQGAMIIAKRFPRNEQECMDRILNACTRQSLAECALYSYSRGGTEITGPSIRLAECIAQLWKNLKFGIRELSQHNGESEVEAFAWDIENNTYQTKTFQVPHIRHTKKGAYALTDPRDIYELVANNGARRLRACILGIIPGDVVDAAVRQIETTLKSKAEVTPEKIATMVEKFGELGVTKDMLEKRVQRRLDTISPSAMVQLGKIYNSLKDGMSAPTDWFDMTAPTDAADDGKPKTGVDALKSAANKTASKKPAPPQEPPPESGATERNESSTQGQPPADNAADADFLKRIQATCDKAEAAKDTEVGWLALEDAKFAMTVCPEHLKAQAQTIIDQCSAKLTAKAKG